LNDKTVMQIYIASKGEALPS